MLNKVILQGRLVANPELRTIPSGVSVANLRIAVDRNYKSKENNTQNTDFITLVAWRATADFVGRYFKKGDSILIDGSLQVREFTDSDGKRRYATEVVIDNAHFPGGKKSNNDNAIENKANEATPPMAALMPEDEEEPQELPF